MSEKITFRIKYSKIYSQIKINFKNKIDSN